MDGKTHELCSCNSDTPSYICPSCQTTFCRGCAKLVGLPSICICRSCGSLCSDYDRFLQERIALADKAAPYGAEDFKAALRFPLQDLSANLGLAVLYGALLFAVPYLGLAGVGIFFGVAGIIPALIACGLLFGCNVRVINAVEAGRTQSRDILDVSEMAAELGETFSLSCGILLVTLMPFAVTLLLVRSMPLAHWLCLGWLFFYYPLALIVAASTISFTEVINPLNGLEVVRASRSVYPKFFFCYVLICAAAGGLVVVTLVRFLQAISGIPVIALLPIFVVLMMALGSLIFYANLVTSYMIGRMLYKVAHRGHRAVEYRHAAERGHHGPHLPSSARRAR